MQFVLTTASCAALVPTDNVKSGIRVFSCVHRHHGRVYIKGDQAISETSLDVHHQDEA